MVEYVSDLVLVLMATWYLAGVRGWWSRIGTGSVVRRWEATCFVAGFVVVVFATAGPIDAVADRSLAGHMVQHVLLLAVAAPLLALGSVVPALAGALPPVSRRKVLRVWGPVHLRLSGAWWPVVVVGALVVHVGVMVAWHLPRLYDEAATHDLVHVAEHASFVITAAAFWWLVLAARRSGPSPTAVLLVFAEAMAAAALGVAMVVARTPWYPVYVARQGTDALVDQQVAGAIMWGYGGVAALAVGAGAFAAWLASGEPSRSTPASSTTPGAGPSPSVGSGPSVRVPSSG